MKIEKIQIISSYKGILSDPIPMQTPCLISNDLRLQDILVSSIAPKKPILKEDGSQDLEENNEDTFIKKEYIIDFLRQDIIVVRGATIEKVNVVNIE